MLLTRTDSAISSVSTIFLRLISFSVADVGDVNVAATNLVDALLLRNQLSSVQLSGEVFEERLCIATLLRRVRGEKRQSLRKLFFL